MEEAVGQEAARTAAGLTMAVIRRDRAAYETWLDHSLGTPMNSSGRLRSCRVL
jgi:hypothetical protein